MKQGLYHPDGTFINFSNNTGPSLSGEIAARSRSLDYYAVNGMYLPNPDPVLKAQGRDVEIYTDLLIDDRVGGGVVNRIGAVKSLVWDIKRGGATARQHKAVQTVFKKLDLNNLFETVIRGARGYGYAPHEVIWGQLAELDGISVPTAIVGKPQRWFVFGQQNELRFRSREQLMNGEELPERRFICPRNEATYDNPYGLGLLSRCFWPVVFKKGGWRFAINFAEKFGTVWPIGKLPRSATPDQISAMTDALVSMISDGVAVIPDDGSVDLKESGTKGATSQLFKDIREDANSAISTVWLGHAGAGQSVSGELGGKGVAGDVRDDIRDDDANLITQFCQTVINWIFEVNWGGAESACEFELKPREEIDTTQAERDDKLTTSMERCGLKLTSKYFQDTYGLAPEHIEVAPTPPPPPLIKGGAENLPLDKGVAFADPFNPFPDQTALDGAIAAISADDMQHQMETVLRPIIEALQKSGNVDAAMDTLIEAYPKMDTAALQEMLTRMIFVADCWGRLNA